MKLPEFNYAKMEWDLWRAFHVVHKYHAFIQFDTGEFVVCHHRWSPEERYVYKEFNIQIVGTDDEECPRLYTPGMAPVVGAKPIPKSHLNHGGQQTLLLDFDHKRAVSIGRWLTEDNAPQIPKRFIRQCRVSAWYAGPEAAPTATPIIRHYPHPLTYDERKHVNELVDACKVWLQMQPDPEALKREYHKTKAPGLKVAEFVDTSFAVLTTEHRTALAVEGFNMIAKETHPWLTFNVEGN